MFAAALALATIQAFQGRGATAVRIAPEEAPVIDGILNDKIWEKAEPIGELWQREPALKSAPSERTIVKFAHDGKNLYVALYCYDSSPKEIRDTQIRRDAMLDPDDRVEFLLDTLHDGRNAYFFQIGPGGSIGDALVSSNGSQFNKAWDGIWSGRAKTTEEGWFAELCIPFRTVTTNKDVTVWGLNVTRYIRRKNEECVWNDPSFDHNAFRISECGTLGGFVDIDHGIGLDVVPYVKTSQTNNHATDNSNFELTGGGDLYYRMTPGMTAGITTNTDFAETEVDDRRVNLTRFPLFFPEKRKFFLEDAGIFNFDVGGGRGGSTDLLPFFSRRIGLVGGDVVPLRAGARVSGFAGPWNVGVLGVNTGRDENLDSQSLGVARIRNNITENSTIGGIVTGGDPSGNNDNQVIGADYKYTTNRLDGGRSLDVTAFGLKSFTNGENGNDRAMGFEVNYPNDLWSWRARAREIGNDFDPRLGFVPRTGVRIYDGALGYSPRVDDTIRQVALRASPRVVTDLKGDTLEAVSSLTFDVEFETGDTISVGAVPRYENVDTTFDIVPGVTVPAGHYTEVRQFAAFETSDKRILSFGVEESAGRHYDGHSVDISESAVWRPGGMLQIGAESEQTFLRLPGGDKDILLGRLRTEVNFSPDLSWQTLAQFDNISKGAGINSRLRWIVDPTKDLFVVFNHEWNETGSSAVVPTSTGFVAKLVFTIRF